MITSFSLVLGQSDLLFKVFFDYLSNYYKKESSKSVSRILFPELVRVLSFICAIDPFRLLHEQNQSGQLCIPCRGETGMYLILQPIRRTASGIATGTGKLLPYLLTFTHRSLAKADCSVIVLASTGSYFLLRYHVLTDIFFSEEWCPLLSGLSSPPEAERQDNLLLSCFYPDWEKPHVLNLGTFNLSLSFWLNKSV